MQRVAHIKMTDFYWRPVSKGKDALRGSGKGGKKKNVRGETGKKGSLLVRGNLKEGRKKDAYGRE